MQLKIKMFFFVFIPQCIQAKQPPEPQKHIPQITINMRECIAQSNPITAAIITAAHFLHSLTSKEGRKEYLDNFSWIKKAFAPSPSVSACLKIIKTDPFAQKVYQKIEGIHDAIRHANSANIIAKAEARMKLLDAQLPPPYDKHLKKAQQKGAEIAETTILSINTYKQIKSDKS